MSTVHKDSSVMARGGRRYGGAGAAIFLLWVILIFAQLGLFLAIHEETGRLVKFLPRKVRFLETVSFHAPSSSSPAHDHDHQSANPVVDDPDKLYGDDKRIIHTGPNPLHN